MADAKSVPVLFVSDQIVLPEMVVPITLDDTAQAAVDAARSSDSGELLIAPRLDDRYPSYGVLASIVRSASPSSCPTSVITPSSIATSAVRAGAPVPSMTVPPRMMSW